MKFVGGNHYH